MEKDSRQTAEKMQSYQKSIVSNVGLLTQGGASVPL